MKTFLRKLFVENWQRKLVSLIIALVIWLVVNSSMTARVTISDIPVQVINIPPGKTLEGLQPNGILQKRMVLTITGNKSVLADLTGNDLKVIIDAGGKNTEWIASITKKNLISLNNDIDLNKISKVSHNDLIITPVNLVTERIPIIITKPIGQPPKDYQYLDIWPYNLYVTVSGPEKTIKQLKSRRLKLTFNLSNITTAELQAIQSAKASSNKDEISYFVPSSWKKIAIPEISESPLPIDDPQAQALRIDFIQKDLLPLNAGIPIDIYYPLKYIDALNPQIYSLATNDFVLEKKGIKLIDKPLFVRGVSRMFLEIVKDWMQLIIAMEPKNQRKELHWNIEFVHRLELEDYYIAKTMENSPQADIKSLDPTLQEEYLRNRFRSYMHTFRIYTPEDKKLHLSITLEDGKIIMVPKNYK
ncbi:MAG: hypothetical protein JW769_02655 [Parachlamydiales bacterium]|nr:hypothetical protein [Parachlamydiales bacterium]